MDDRFVLAYEFVNLYKERQAVQKRRILELSQKYIELDAEHHRWTDRNEKRHFFDTLMSKNA